MRIFGIITLVLTSLFTLLFLALVVVAIIFFDTLNYGNDVYLAYAVFVLAIVHLLELWFNATTLKYHKYVQRSSDALVLDELEDANVRPKQSLTTRKRTVGVLVAVLSSLVFVSGLIATIVWYQEELARNRAYGYRVETEALAIFIGLLLYVGLKLVYTFATLSLNSKGSVQAVS